MKIGDIVQYHTNQKKIEIGMIISITQSAWGTVRYKVLLQSGIVKHIWGNKLKRCI